MTSSLNRWHVDGPTMRAYADGAAPPVVSASVESHLMVCADCRADLTPLMPEEPLAQTWDAIRATVGTPRRSAVERALGRLGVSEESARLMAAVPAFGEAWLAGMVAATVFCGAASMLSTPLGLAAFLLIAPLAPVAGVWASFGVEADPTYELSTSSPYPALRLLLLRTAGVLALSVPAAVLVGAALPGPLWLAVAWLTPAAAGVTLCLALTPRLGATASAVAVGAAWSVVVAVAARAQHPAAAVDLPMQLTLGAVTLAALAVLTVSHTWFDQLERQS